MGYLVTHQKEFFEIKTFDSEDELLDFLSEEYNTVDYKLGLNRFFSGEVHINQYTEITQEVEFDKRDDSE